MSLFTRNLAKCGKPISLFDRDITVPVGGGVNYDIALTNQIDVQAIVKTPQGVTVFDEVGTAVDITHEFCIAWVAGIDNMNWVQFNLKNYRIDSTINCCENDEKIRLLCTVRGPITKAATDA